MRFWRRKVKILDKGYSLRQDKLCSRCANYTEHGQCAEGIDLNYAYVAFHCPKFKGKGEGAP